MKASEDALTKNQSERCSGDFDLLTAPGHLLRRNHQRSYDIFARIVGDDVTRQQIAVLTALSQNPGSSQRELVERTGIDKSTVKEMIGRMVTRDLVSREQCPKDNRAWTIKLTKKGYTLLKERLPKVRIAQEEIMAPLSREEREIFIRCLRTLVGLEPNRTI